MDRSLKSMSGFEYLGLASVGQKIIEWIKSQFSPKTLIASKNFYSSGIVHLWAFYFLLALKYVSGESFLSLKLYSTTYLFESFFSY